MPSPVLTSGPRFMRIGGGPQTLQVDGSNLDGANPLLTLHDGVNPDLVGVWQYGDPSYGVFLFADPVGDPIGDRTVTFSSDDGSANAPELCDVAPLGIVSIFPVTEPRGSIFTMTINGHGLTAVHAAINDNYLLERGSRKFDMIPGSDVAQPDMKVVTCDFDIAFALPRLFDVVWTQQSFATVEVSRLDRAFTVTYTGRIVQGILKGIV